MRRDYWQFLGQDAAFFGLVVSAALSVGILLDQFRDDPLGFVYRTKEQRIMSVVTRQNREEPVKPVETVSFQEYVSVGQLKNLLLAREGIVIDARPEVFHRVGHIPGALSLPREDFENAYLKWKGTLGADKAQTIVVYCSSMSCQDSELVRRALVALGYSRVAILKGGWAAWRGEDSAVETEL